MQKKYLFIIALLISSLNSFAQNKKDSIPLFSFLQANFDTTIILHSFSTWSSAPNYEIICQKNNELYPFTYSNPFKNYKGRELPKSLQEKLRQQNLNMIVSPADTNAYFLPVNFKYQQEPIVKKLIKELKLWNLGDDISEGQGCDRTCGILDGGEYFIYLISKNEIKKLYFYDPVFYEGCCPSRKSRQSAIQLIKIMNSVCH